MFRYHFFLILAVLLSVAPVGAQQTIVQRIASSDYQIDRTIQGGRQQRPSAVHSHGCECPNEQLTPQQGKMFPSLELIGVRVDFPVERSRISKVPPDLGSSTVEK